MTAMKPLTWLTMMAAAAFLAGCHASGTPNLHDAMHDLEEHLDATATLVDEGRLAEARPHAVAMQQLLGQASRMEPPQVKNLDDAARARYLAGYRTAMGRTVALADQLVAALDAGDQAKARDLVQALDKAEDQGHASFRDRKGVAKWKTAGP